MEKKNIIVEKIFDFSFFIKAEELLIMILLMFPVGLFAQKCLEDLSVTKRERFTPINPYKLFFYADAYLTPHIQHVRGAKNRLVSDMAYGGNFGVRFPNRLAMDIGVAYYNTNGEFEEQQQPMYVNADFLELNTQLKYYFGKKKINWYPLLMLTANFIKPNEPIIYAYPIAKKYDYSFSYISLGAGIEKGISKKLSLYAEPVARIKISEGWQVFIYRYALRLSLGLKFKIQ